jgi:hypothetical protein
MRGFHSSEMVVMFFWVVTLCSLMARPYSVTAQKTTIIIKYYLNLSMVMKVYNSQLNVQLLLCWLTTKLRCFKSFIQDPEQNRLLSEN